MSALKGYDVLAEKCGCKTAGEFALKVTEVFAIVEKLAKYDPIEDEGDGIWCRICLESGFMDKLEHHLPTCLWRRAVEVMR